MQYINLNKTMEFENVITDLLLISIDDQIDTVDDKDGIKISGNIKIGGKVNTIEGEKEFDDSVQLDIFLTHEEILERNLLNVSVNDFNYNIEDNKLLLNISLKIDGLKEIETTFLAKEDSNHDEETLIEDEVNEGNGELEIENEKKVYIEVDIDVNDRKQTESEEENHLLLEREVVDIREETIENQTDDLEIFDDCNEGNEKEIKNDYTSDSKRKSLLRSVFSNKRFNEEVSWRLHCVKGEKSYEEIASKYNVNLKKLVSLNKDEKLEEGKLIFLPLE